MTHNDAVTFLTPAGPFHGTWADIGAGTGTFSRALAELLGRDGAVIAIDTNERALARVRTTVGAHDGVRSRTARAHDAHAPIRTVRADMHDLSAVDGLAGTLDGVLFANVLHFTRKADDVVAHAAQRLTPDGRIVVIEYERRMPNPWVPHPLPLAKLADVATRAGLGAPREVARRASSYHREMYCAVLRRESD